MSGSNRVLYRNGPTAIPSPRYALVRHSKQVEDLTAHGILSDQERMAIHLLLVWRLLSESFATEWCGASLQSLGQAPAPAHSSRGLGQ